MRREQRTANTGLD